MKYMLTGSYPFDPAAKTIDFTSVSGFGLKSLIAIVNQTAGVVIYNPAAPSSGGTLAGSVLTLAYDTTSMHSGDTLLVFYDEQVGGGKTIKDLWDELASTLAVSDGTTHTALASIYAELDLLATAAQLPVSLGSKPSAGSLSVTGASDGYFIVGGTTADGSAPAAGTYSVRIGGQDANGNKRTLLLKPGGELPTYSPALTITENFNGALTASYQKVVTTTAATKMLRMSAACNATAYDIEFQVVTAGGAAPSTTGMALLAGDDFPLGIPIGDIYARSASLQKLIVWSA